MNKIVHCAAQVSVAKSVKNPRNDAMHNIIGTINILEYARKIDADQFVYISSAAVYGEPQYLPVDEKHPQDPKSPYGLSKLAGERYALLYRELYGLRVSVVRPFNIFSPRQDPKNPYSGVISIFVRRAKRGLPLIIYGDGNQTRDFVSIDDVIHLIRIIIERDEEGTYNCGTGRETSINELADIVKNVSGKKLKIVYKPWRRGDIKRSYADISRARKIGFAPTTDLNEDIKRYFF